MSEETGPLPSEGHTGESREAWRKDRTTFQRVYDVITGVTEFTTASAIGDRADCSDAGARDALAQLIEMGIVEKEDGRPAKYRRNESYFQWRRIEELASNTSVEELESQLEALIEEDASFQNRFDAQAPDAVSPAAFEADDHAEIQDRFEAVTRWRSVRHDIKIIRRAIYRATTGVSRESSDGISA